MHSVIKTPWFASVAFFLDTCLKCKEVYTLGAVLG